VPEVIKLCFLGSADKERADFLNQLANHNIPIDVYGNDWNRFQLHSSITIHPPVYDMDYWKVLRKYRVQLNLMRVHNPQSHNMRSFEVPAVGGIGLFPDTPDHRNFFKNGKEIFLYMNAQDCASKARELLKLDSKEAMNVRRQARTRCVEAGYSYKNRTHQFLELLRDLA
jgi:spore maturation protein CgeB